MNLEGAGDIDRALRLVGELLEARDERIHIVVLGGAAVNLLGFVSRATTDVDILAFARDEGMRDAAAAVASDLGLDPQWLNTGPASQWRTGLPPGLDSRLRWRDYGGLVVGVVARLDLIHFKLYAAADDTGPSSVHFQDLVALAPTDEELEKAAGWVREQDPSPGVAATVSQVIDHARRHRDRTR